MRADPVLLIIIGAFIVAAAFIIENVIIAFWMAPKLMFGLMCLAVLVLVIAEITLRFLEGRVTKK